MIDRSEELREPSEDLKLRVRDQCLQLLPDEEHLDIQFALDGHTLCNIILDEGHCTIIEGEAILTAEKVPLIIWKQIVLNADGKFDKALEVERLQTPPTTFTPGVSVEISELLDRSYSGGDDDFQTIANTKYKNTDPMTLAMLSVSEYEIEDILGRIQLARANR